MEQAELDEFLKRVGDSVEDAVGARLDGGVFSDRQVLGIEDARELILGPAMTDGEAASLAIATGAAFLLLGAYLLYRERKGT
jgi:hypothetical protein